MIESLTLKFTKSPDITLPGHGVTVLVGPNSSGKSLALREIESAIGNPGPSRNMKLVRDFEIDWPVKEDIERMFFILKREVVHGDPPGHVRITFFRPDGNIDRAGMYENLIYERATASKDKHFVSSHLLKYFVTRLDGRSRFMLCQDRETGDLLAIPNNILSGIFKDDDVRTEVRNLIHDAIKLYFVIDPTHGGRLRIRLSRVPPISDEQSLNHAAREFHRQATYIQEASDGLQAYVGIIIAVLAGRYRLILIDEPEAFLHPPLARKLGFQLAQIAARHGSTLVAATHSADFLIGCVQGAPSNVRVVRLEYSNGASKGRLVNTNSINKIYNNPLTRSADVISALFYDGVVVTEADSDRVFYGEIYHRMSELDTSLPSILFTNAQNKQTIREIMGPLREFGVPAAAIADLDVIKEGGTVWSAWLAAAQVPDASRSGFSNQRDSLCKCFAAANVNMGRGGGVAALTPDDKRAADQLFDLLDEYGFFVVRRGELEQWMPELGARGKKKDWVVSALEKLGSDPAREDYVKPGSGDVWEFMAKIAAWIRNPSRRGTL